MTYHLVSPMRRVLYLEPNVARARGLVSDDNPHAMACWTFARQIGISRMYMALQLAYGELSRWS